MKSKMFALVAFFAVFAVMVSANEMDCSEIISSSGVKGGLVVHIGCGDGRVTAQLRVNDSYIVHGLDVDAEKIAKAREYIGSLGVYGDVSVDIFDGRRLPYVDNLVNLVVAQRPGDVEMAEIMRVLCPKGVAYVKKDGKWNKTVKSWPDDIDEWGHFLHDAGNNAVADDSVVGPPRSVQWVAGPLWLRSHETPSGVQAQVSADGRLYYIFDEGLVGIIDERLPDKWSIICRDAFNGKQLWKRSIEPWGWRQWAREKWEGKDWTVVRSGRGALPDENNQRLVADGGRLYATLGFKAPLTILDGATGRVIRTVEETNRTAIILASDGIVVCYVEGSRTQAGKRRGKDGKIPPRLVAVNGQTGKILWEKETGWLKAMFIAIDDGRVIYREGGELAAVGLSDGKDLWRTELEIESYPVTLVAKNSVVLIKSKEMLNSYNASDGKLLWSKAHKVVWGGASSVDLFVANGLVWPGMASVNDKREPMRKMPNVLSIGLDLQTGEVKKRIFVPDFRSSEHHHRCYRNKATSRFLLSSLEGVEFLDIQSGHHRQNNWVRGACKLGIMPCNGLLYAPSDQCFCEPGSKLRGYMALGPARKVPMAEIPDEERLTKGPAFGRGRDSKPKKCADDWPTFRHDASRSGSTKMALSPNIKEVWNKKIGGKLSAPVAAEGKIFVAACDWHKLYAIDMESGDELWEYTAGGRIDSAPTVFNGLVLFGCKDGRVYCLRASDGKLVWRFTAAPADRRIGYFGQVESAWPVHGSVLVENGVAYFTAGRSTYLDGGIRVYALEPATGEILHKNCIEGPFPEERGKRDYSYYLLGANSDVLVAEGGYIYMRQKKFSRELQVVETKVLSELGAMDVGTHIFSTSGLLDDSWFDRTFWMYSKRWPGYQIANQAPKSGQLLVFDEDNTYAVKVFYVRNAHSPMFFPGKEGYLLFADKNTTEPQVLGEKGAVEPVEWLPMSDYSRGKDGIMRALDSAAFERDKGIGYTRGEPPLWKKWLSIRIRAMVKAADTLFVAGDPDVYDPQEPFAAFEGRKGGRLAAVSAKDGDKLMEMELDSAPVFDGLIAAGGKLFMVTMDGEVVCFGK